MRAAVLGFGAVGRRVARDLAADPTFEEIVVVRRSPHTGTPLSEPWPEHVEIRSGGVEELGDAEVVVVAAPELAERAVSRVITRGGHAVCATGDPAEVLSLLDLDEAARRSGSVVAIGTVMAPGLTCVLAARLRQGFDSVDEIHVASVGTGGPACARQRHSALAGVASDWEGGEWRRRQGGSGRELVWFPEPVGGADCYRAALADPLLLVPAFPECRRVTSRIEATRRDRVTAWLPMLRQPHPEGRVGAVRVEMRGWVRGRAETEVLGAAVPPAAAAAVVSASAARWAVSGQLERTGVAGLAELVSVPGRFLRELTAGGVTVSTFAGNKFLEQGADLAG